LTKYSIDIDYSVVDIYKDLFEQILTGELDNEILNVAFDSVETMEKCFTEDKLKDRIKNSKNLMRSCYNNLIPLLYDKNNNLKPFKNKFDRMECLKKIKKYILARILVPILIDLYVKSDHLRTRNKEYIYKDLMKLDLLCQKGCRINGKFYPTKIYNKKSFNMSLDVFNQEILNYQDAEPILIDQ